jgi:uncharacterized membrane protein YphA (DoxX/SURF4 family)
MRRQLQYGLYLALRLILGGVFIWASWGKIIDPEGFAEVIRNYRIIPEAWVNPVALWLPWSEALCGLLLISGRWLYGSIWIVNTALLVFILALAFNWYRGIDVGCGCFSLSAEYRAGEYLIDILRDFAFLAAGLWIGWYRIRTDAVIRDPDSGFEM